RAWSKHFTSSGVTTYSPSVPAGSTTPSDRRGTKSSFWTCSGMSISSRGRGMDNTFLRAGRPVLGLQPRHLFEVLPVACHQRRLVRQGDAGDEQVSPADLLQPLRPEQAVELGGRGGIERDNRELGQINLGPLKPLLGTQQLLPVGGSHQEREAALKSLDAGD